jgi:biopolymer transport protein ExbD
MEKSSVVLVLMLLISLVSQVMAVPVMPGEDSTLSTTKQIKTIHLEAKNKYLTAKNAYLSSKSEFLTARSKWQLAKNTENQDLVVGKGKKFLTKTVDKIINQLEQLRIRIGTSEYIVEPVELNSEIKKHLALLDNLHDDIIAIETQEDLIEASKLVKTEWVSVKVLLKKYSGFVLISKAKEGISKARKISGKIEIKLQNLEERGFDIKEFNERLSQVDSNIIIAEDFLKKAHDKYSEISDSETANSLFIEASGSVKQAKNVLKKTYVEIKDIVIKLRTMSTPRELPGGSI